METLTSRETRVRRRIARARIRTSDCRGASLSSSFRVERDRSPRALTLSPVSTPARARRCIPGSFCVDRLGVRHTTMLASALGIVARGCVVLSTSREVFLFSVFALSPMADGLLEVTHALLRRVCGCPDGVPAHSSPLSI